MPKTVQVCRLENDLQELVPSFQHVGYQGENPGPQVWQLMSLPSEPSHQEIIAFWRSKQEHLSLRPA